MIMVIFSSNSLQGIHHPQPGLLEFDLIKSGESASSKIAQWFTISIWITRILGDLSDALQNFRTNRLIQGSEVILCFWQKSNFPTHSISTSSAASISASEMPRFFITSASLRAFSRLLFASRSCASKSSR